MTRLVRCVLPDTGCQLHGLDQLGCLFCVSSQFTSGPGNSYSSCRLLAVCYDAPPAVMSLGNDNKRICITTHQD